MPATHPQQSSNNGNGSMQPLRDKVQFVTNVPQRLTLEFDPPEEPRAGRFGDQYMYFFSGSKIAWFDPPVHARIVASGAGAGEEIEICKRETKKGNRKTTTWEVICLNQDYTDAEAEAAAAASVRAAIGDADPFRPFDNSPLPIENGRSTPATPPPAAPQPARQLQDGTPYANPLAQALILAIDAVEIANAHGQKKYDWDEGLHLGDEAIVKLAITAYIQAQGGKAARP